MKCFDNGLECKLDISMGHRNRINKQHHTFLQTHHGLFIALFIEQRMAKGRNNKNMFDATSERLNNVNYNVNSFFIVL